MLDLTEFTSSYQDQDLYNVISIYTFTLYTDEVLWKIRKQVLQMYMWIVSTNIRHNDGRGYSHLMVKHLEVSILIYCIYIYIYLISCIISRYTLYTWFWSVLYQTSWIDPFQPPVPSSHTPTFPGRTALANCWHRGTGTLRGDDGR